MRFIVVLIMLLAACAAPESTAPDAGLSSLSEMPATDSDAIDARGPVTTSSDVTDSCAHRCERDLSCGVFPPEKYVDCYQNCLADWADCEYLADFEECMQSAEDVCAIPCEKHCDPVQ